MAWVQINCLSIMVFEGKAIANSLDLFTTFEMMNSWISGLKVVTCKHVNPLLMQVAQLGKMKSRWCICFLLHFQDGNNWLPAGVINFTSFSREHVEPVKLWLITVEVVVVDGLQFVAYKHQIRGLLGRIVIREYQPRIRQGWPGGRDDSGVDGHLQIQTWRELDLLNQQWVSIN